MRTGTFELVQEVRSREVGGGTEIEYVADVEGPDWLAQFIRHPPSAVEERFASIDDEKFLTGVRLVNPRLARDTRELVALMDGGSLRAIQAGPFISHIETIFAHAQPGERWLLLMNGPDPKPVSLRGAVLEAFRQTTEHIDWDELGVDLKELLEDRPLEVLANSGFKVTELFACAADGMASGVWRLMRVHIGKRGYLAFDFPDDGRYAGGALLVGWEPASSTAAYRAALKWAYREYGVALRFPYTCRDIEVESIRNARLFRSIAAKAGGGERVEDPL